MVILPTRAQDRLDRAFLGYVRINVVTPELGVTSNWKVINKREIDPQHEKMLVQSFRERKEDWEHPMHLTLDGSKIDPSCLSRSPYPVKDLKPLVWICPPTERVMDCLSGNHRRGAARKYSAELAKELTETQAKLRTHQAQQASGGQKQITAAGGLTDEVAEGLREKIAALEEAAADAQLWVEKVYDSRKSRASRIKTKLTTA